MKIAYFVAEYRTFAGSQKSLLYAMRAWKQQGGEILAILPGEGLCAEMYRRHNIPTFVLPAPSSLHLFQRRLLNLSLWQRLCIWLSEVLPYSYLIAKFLRKEKVSILHCNSTRSILIAGWLPRWQNVSTLLHVHGKQIDKGLLWNIAQWLAVRIILVANHLRTEVCPLFQAKTRLLYNAIIPEEIELLSLNYIDEFLISIQLPKIITFSSIIPTKGIHHLIRAANLVQQKFPSLFIVVGAESDKVYAAYVQKLSQELCGQLFVFTGWLDNPYPLLRQSDVAVIATIKRSERVPTDNPRAMPLGEGLPLFLLEAMALGKPIVATRTEGNEEVVIDGETGYLVPPADPQALAEAILRLLKDPFLRCQMGQKGKERVQSLFSMDRYQAELVQIYAEVIK
jgi:glycosyltransferase involved in cell wall biosynthesis